MSRSCCPPPHFFNPDDKRSYLLTVFLSSPFVTLAVPMEAGGFRPFDFPSQTGIYALYLSEVSLSETVTPQQRNEDLRDDLLVTLRMQLVYIGKTSHRGTLRGRLADHYRKIDSRRGLSVDRILVRYLVIEDDWNTLFAEYKLVEAPELSAEPPPPWNTNGFGMHAPGAGRPGKRAKPANHFDVLYPPKK